MPKKRGELGLLEKVVREIAGDRHISPGIMDEETAYLSQMYSGPKRKWWLLK